MPWQVTKLFSLQISKAQNCKYQFWFQKETTKNIQKMIFLAKNCRRHNHWHFSSDLIYTKNLARLKEKKQDTRKRERTKRKSSNCNRNVCVCMCLTNVDAIIHFYVIFAVECVGQHLILLDVALNYIYVYVCI